MESYMNAHFSAKVRADFILNVFQMRRSCVCVFDRFSLLWNVHMQKDLNLKFLGGLNQFLDL